MDRCNRLLGLKGVNTVFTVNQRTSEILSKSIHWVFWILVFLDYGDATTLCTQASASYSIPVSSLCYKTSASANLVALDGFLTYQSSTTYCGCTLTSTQNTTVGFTSLGNLEPHYDYCGSSIRVQSGGTAFRISCYISGTISVSPTQPVTLYFEKPAYGYNSNYCMLLSSDNLNAILTLNCNVDPDLPRSTSIPLSTTKTTTTRQPSKASTTPAPTTTQTTTTTITTTQRTTTAPTTTAPTTTKTTPSTTRLTATTTATPKTIASYLVTRQSTANIHVRLTASSIWNWAVPAIGAGIVLICVTVLVVCFRHRRKHKKPSNDRTVVYVSDTKINLPYSPDYKYEERSSEIARGSSTHIYDVIL